MHVCSHKATAAIGETIRACAYHRQVNNIVTAIGLDPSVVTVYALRHSSIVRMLLQNVPIRRGIAAQHERRHDRADIFETYHGA